MQAENEEQSNKASSCSTSDNTFLELSHRAYFCVLHLFNFSVKVLAQTQLL